jgi:hypothetical protein
MRENFKRHDEIFSTLAENVNKHDDKFALIAENINKHDGQFAEMRESVNNLTRTVDRYINARSTNGIDDKEEI